MVSRRRFIMTLAPVMGAGLLGMKGAQAQAGVVSETEPTAVALGYRVDASKVDPKKFPTFRKGDNCANCVLFTGKPGAATGPCGAFGNRLVSTNGWCSAHARKG